MSDLLIRGMKMPCEEAEPLHLELYADGTVIVIKEQDDFYEFKAVPVPPHGRLIDADKMKESIRKQTAFLRLIGGEFAEIAETLEKGFLQEIANAPTIISAEEGE